MTGTHIVRESTKFAKGKVSPNSVVLMNECESKSEHGSNDQESRHEPQGFAQDHLAIDQKDQRDEQRQITDESTHQNETYPRHHSALASLQPVKTWQIQNEHQQSRRNDRHHTKAHDIGGRKIRAFITEIKSCRNESKTQCPRSQRAQKQFDEFHTSD